MSQYLDGQIIAQKHFPLRNARNEPPRDCSSSGRRRRLYKKRCAPDMIRDVIKSDEMMKLASINSYKEEGPENYEEEISVTEHASTDNSEDEDSED